jgi:hypothetical protein
MTRPRSPPIARLMHGIPARQLHVARRMNGFSLPRVVVRRARGRVQPCAVRRAPYLALVIHAGGSPLGVAIAP